MRKPHVVISPGTYAGPPAAGEFRTRLRGVGQVTVTPGPDADWGDVLEVLRGQAPRGTARRYHQARVLYDGAMLAQAGSYRDGAELGWAA